jgi:hypothetical protein
MAYLRAQREVLDRYPEVVAPVADEDLHVTVQSARQHLADGRRADAQAMRHAADELRSQLVGFDPFPVTLGQARASGSAVVIDLWPEGQATALNQRVRTALEAAGMLLPPATTPLWLHLTAGYGRADTDTPELAARSDRLASEIGRTVRARPAALVDRVALVWERQHPEAARYTFDTVAEVKLGA